MAGRNGPYLIRRTIMLIPMTIGLAAIVFALIHLSPGDPALAMVSEQGSDPEIIAQVRANLGLDKPLPVQFGIWLKNVAQFDFGLAYSFNRTPVIDLITQRLGATILLQVISLAVSIAIAVPLGILAATRRNTLLDHLTTGGSFLGLALPTFWFALLLQLFFSVQLGWLPAATAGQDASGLGKLPYYVMPVIVLALPTIAILSRYVRSGMIDVIGQEYVTAARAKGLGERAILYRHALRNAILPMITVLGSQAAHLLSGSVVVENIYAWPGLGALAFDAILRRDYPVILALTLLTGVFILIVNLLVDVAYMLVDPRITFE